MAQLGVLPLELLDLGSLLTGQPSPLPGVDLRAAHPLTQRLGATDPELGRDRTDRRSLRRILAPCTSATIRTARSRSSCG